MNFLKNTDDALLALFGAIYPEEKARALSEKLTRTYGSISHLRTINASVLEEEIGKEAALYLKLSLSLSIRRETERLKNGETVNEAMLVRHFTALYADMAEEAVYALFLDQENRLISLCRVATGSADASALQPRQILELSTRLRAGAVILTHNHPGGTLTPSASDKKITLAIQTALLAIRTRFLGHYIFADSDFIRLDEEEALAGNTCAPSLQKQPQTF